ncbi:dicarboxylate/amino acid:cation symporter [Prosthecobacter sp. SYSU 5D2]|uniref:dicarboxylate/amino acid:cation symporter n=1 Tax=Prosthecobacter sp. SYSU 5D2 TaxID=3134134 RepID=UPI0031FEF325
MPHSEPSSPPASSGHGNHKHIVFALILGVLAGLVLQYFAHPAEGAAPAWTGVFLESCRFFADLFLRALKMIIVPLVVASIISGIAGLKSLEGFARMGLKTWGYYALSSLLAVCVGLMMVNLVQPGLLNGEPNPTLRAAMDSALKSDTADVIGDVMERADGGASSLLNIVRRMVPTNIIQAAAEGDLLALIFFSILFAVAMVLVPGGPPRALQDLFNQLADVMTVITTWIMKFTPIAIFCLVIPAIAEVGIGVIQNLVPYVLTVFAALAFTTVVIMPLILKFFAGVSPIRHFRNMRESMLMAFSTASSSATIPVTLRCVRENSKVSERVSSFVIPLGATVNMNGTALYECVVVVFAAQVLGVDMSISQQLIVVLLALVSSIGVAGIPAASLVAIIIIMQNAGFSEDMIKASLGLVLTIDRPLDMLRTTVNVFSDTVGAVLIAKSEGEAVQ